MPEQVVSEATFIVALGSKVIVIVNPAVLQPPGTEGVTKYVTVWLPGI
jgi:hypothetical protein